MAAARFYSPVRVEIFAVALAAALTIALLPIQPERGFPARGQSAAEPVAATADLSFESEILTQRAQDAAAAGVVASVTFDTGIGNDQNAALTDFLSEVDRIRDDPELTPEERARELGLVPGAQLSPRAQVLILGLNDLQWQGARGLRGVRARAITLLREIMGGSITDGEVAATRAGLSARVGPGFSPDQTEIVDALVAPRIVANVREDVAATEAARTAVRESVAPVIQEFEKGDLIVPAGEPVDDLAEEVLLRLPLPQKGGGIPIDDLVAVLILALAGSLTLGAYFVLAAPQSAASDRRLLLVAVLVVGMVAASRWFLPVVLPDERDKALDLVLPLAVAPVLVAALLERTLALLVAMVIAVLAGAAALIHPDYAVGEAPEAAQALRPLAVFLFSGVAGVFAMQRAERLTQYGVTGGAVGASLFLVGLAFWLLNPSRASADLGWLALVAAIVFVSTGVLTIGASWFLGLAFGVTTRLQLLELAQLTQPLLRRLQEETPGTFHHSLLVATMAQRAAAEIGADALLVRVGAYYHDIGKLSKPHMYIENQADGENPHDDLDPLESARVIQDHVRWGMELGRQQRLAPPVRAFIPEHHGTRLVTYFYRKAARIDPDVDPALFTYAGPRPQSRETAIVMMADSCEAVVRSSRQRDMDTIDRLIDAVINERVNEQQFDDCDLTLREIRTIAESFKVTLRGVYHPRIEYPAPTAAEQERLAAAAPPQGVGAAPEPVGDAPVDGSSPPALSQSRE